MEERMFEFYCSLPRIGQVPLYIPGYTESVMKVSGVRIIPSYTFTTELPGFFRKFFDSMSYPCYYVPIKMQDRHYGFILKGEAKATPRFSTYCPFFNLDALYSEKPYCFLVEGIKDAGIFLERGEPVVSMMTSGMSVETVSVFNLFRKVLVQIIDNDKAGRNGAKDLLRPTTGLKVPIHAIIPSGHKDMGNYYDSPGLRSFVERTYSMAISTARNSTGGSFLFRRV